VQCSLLKTVEEFRTILSSQQVRLPQNAQFLDAQEYPVPIVNEKLLKISDLVRSTNDGNIIKLKAKENSIITTKNIIIFLATLCFAF
jgi:hypothetical protein